MRLKKSNAFFFATTLSLIFITIIASCDKDKLDCNGAMSPPPNYFTFTLSDSLQADSIVVFNDTENQLIKFNAYDFDSINHINYIFVSPNFETYYLSYNNQFDTLSFVFYKHEGKCWDRYTFDIYFNQMHICNQCESDSCFQLIM